MKLIHSTTMSNTKFYASFGGKYLMKVIRRAIPGHSIISEDLVVLKIIFKINRYLISTTTNVKNVYRLMCVRKRPILKCNNTDYRQI